MSRPAARPCSAFLIAIALSGVAACGTAPAAGTASAVSLDLGAPAPPTTVPARANIFGAGHDVPPDPGGGGSGVLPPAWRLPAGAGRVLTFQSVTGTVNPIRDYARFVSAAGDEGRFGTTDVTSFGGISGIVHRHNGMFLVGVLLADSSPAEPAASAAGMERCFDGVFNDSLKINHRHDFDDHIGYGATYHWCAADGQVTTFVVDTTYGEDAG